MVKEGDHLEDDILQLGIALQRMGFVPCRQFLQRVRDALHEMRFLLDQSSEAISTKHLKKAKIHKKGIVAVKFDR